MDGEDGAEGTASLSREHDSTNDRVPQSTSIDADLSEDDDDDLGAASNVAEGNDEADLPQSGLLVASEPSSRAANLFNMQVGFCSLSSKDSAKFTLACHAFYNHDSSHEQSNSQERSGTVQQSLASSHCSHVLSCWTHNPQRDAVTILLWMTTGV